MGTVLAANAAYTTYRFVKEANQLSPEERWGQGDRLALKNINTSRPGK